MDFVGGDRQDHSNLIAPAVPLIWPTGIALSQLLNVFGPAFVRDVSDMPTDGEIARGVCGIADCDGHMQNNLACG